MKSIRFFLIISFVYSIISCGSSTYEDIAAKPENITYSNAVKPIIDNNCISCHGDLGNQFPKLDTYTQVKDATETGDVLCRIDDQSCGSVMPQGGRMTQTNINIIKKWAENKFPN